MITFAMVVMMLGAFYVAIPLTIVAYAFTQCRGEYRRAREKAKSLVAYSKEPDQDFVYVNLTPEKRQAMMVQFNAYKAAALEFGGFVPN